MKHALSCLGVLWCLLAGSAQSAPPSTLEGAIHDSDAAALASWHPMKGSLPVLARRAENQPTLELRCNFVGTQIERASWDHPLQLDLSSARGIQFEVRCEDMSPVSYFSVYFQSGGGWYHASWFPEKENAWHTITIDRAEMSPEGEPAGWNVIRTIRISAWRGKDKDTRFFIRGLRPTGKLGVDASVAVLRGDSGANRWPDQASSIQRAALRMAEDFRAAGVGCALLSDTNVTTAQLKGAKLIVLPHNPHLGPDAIEAISGWIRNGGKALVFYSLPSELHPVLNLAPGITRKATHQDMFSAIQFLPRALPGAPDRLDQNSWMIHSIQPEAGKSRKLADWLDAQGKPTGDAAVIASSNSMFMTHVLLAEDSAARRQLLLAMAGSLVPDLWRETMESRLKALAELGQFTEFAPLTNHIARISNGKAPAQTALKASIAHRQKARELFGTRKYPEALNEVSLAAKKLEEAFCRAQQPQWPEFRGFWCHSAFGVKGMTWDEAISLLSENGFTAIVPNMLWGGAAFYDSQVLPQAAALAKPGDQIKECLTACRKHGLEMHVWKVNYYLGTHAPQEFVDRMKKEGRLQVSFTGESHNWLCPSHPENQKLEIDSMVEVARNYLVDGIHFDYIRYPGQDYCFCEGCKSRFEKAAGLKVATWPKDLRATPVLQQRWNDWRRSNITTVVKAVSEQARAARPKIKISAAVFRLWDQDRDSVAQDWKIWCDRGYLDFVCPMDYTPSDRAFENMVARQVEWAGKVPCYPGLGVSASRSKFGADRAIEQILITRKHKTGGFMIFNYGPKEASELVPLLGLGITAPR